MYVELEHDQLQNLLDQMKRLEKMATMQLYVIGFHEEPEREEMENLANGLRDIGERLIAILGDEERADGIISVNSGQSNENEIEPIIEPFKDIYHEIRLIYYIYTESLIRIYKGALYDLGMQMKDHYLQEFGIIVSRSNPELLLESHKKIFK